jgi:hypothetical protein
MTDKELDLQKKVVSVFQELQIEKALLDKKVTQSGYQRRNALISNVYSDYNKHEELNERNIEWEKNLTQYNIVKWLYDLFVEHRDLMGYFDNYDKIIEEIGMIRDAAIKKEEYKIAETLTFWRNKLPK